MVHATIKQDANIYSIGGQQSLYLHSAFNKETENQDSNAPCKLDKLEETHPWFLSNKNKHACGQWHDQCLKSKIKYNFSKI